MSCLKLTWLLTRFTYIYLISCLFSVGPGTCQTVREDVRKHPNWKLLNVGEHCGLSYSDRIIGGTQASLGQYPWIVRVGYAAVGRRDQKPEVYYACGGALISDRYVLTAAHCDSRHNFPDWLRINLVQVRLGEYDMRSDPDCEYGSCAPRVLNVQVEEYSCHPGYEKTKQQDDVCLIRLARPIRFNKYVHPICLPVYKWFQNKKFENSTMEVAGWGLINVANRTSSEVLQTLTVPLTSDTVCQQTYNDLSPVTHKQMCAGGVVGQDSCTGDSGGPLMTPLSVDAPPRYFLMGIVSYGDTNCGQSEAPGVYTKVTEYLSWILDHIRE